MEVRPGYKPTEVGVIPVDWEVRSLGSIGTFKNGINKPIEEFGYGSPFVNLLNIFGVSFISSTDGLGLLNTTTFEQGIYNLKRGDVLFVRSSVKPSGVGLTTLVGEDLPRAVYSGFLIRFRSDGSLFRDFKRFCFNEESFRRRLTDASSVSANTNINQSNLSKLPLCIPTSLTEQEAIAEALSDADALIESLEQLTVKKRQIKQGAMHELLRPKEGWEKDRLGNLGVFSKGSGVRKDETQSGELPCVRYGEIYTRHNDYVKDFYSWLSPSVASTARRLKRGDILFAGSGETKEEIGKCVAFIDDVEAYAGGDIVILRPEAANSLFLGYYLNTPSIAQQKASKGQGDAVVHISSSALANIDICLPEPKEQEIISGIIYDMDAEINALEAKLSKARQVKQGMMQELLTGRVRLV